MTTSPKNCPQCGKPLPSNAPAGLCPRCVMAMNMATETQFSGDVGPHGTKVLKTAPTPEELAAKFPQLEILELLGRGGMGAVYKARQKELDRIVALKILPPGIGDDPGFAERFTREAKALAKLNHPNIVTLYEFGRADGLFFFLMEFVDGVNLRQLLNTGRVASREALAIVPQICDALQFAHDHGIVHRDIKPENILMDRRGKVKVADFGLAKLVGTERGSPSRSVPEDESGQKLSDAQSTGEAAAGHRPAVHELTEAGKVMGTPQYMAPEQKDRPLEVDHRADIYALGVVFYQMLTGELPGKRIEAPSKKVHIDVRLDEIVLRALESKPELRYQQASAFKTQVETIASTPNASEPIKKNSIAKHSGVARIWTWVGIVNVQLVITIFVWFATGKAFSLPISVIAVLIIATLFDFIVMRSTSTEPAGPERLDSKSNLLTREVVSQKTGRHWIQMILFAAAVFFFAIGIWKLTQFDLNPHELFFGVFLVCILALVTAALGFLAFPASAFSEATKSDEATNLPKATGREILWGNLAMILLTGGIVLTLVLWFRDFHQPTALAILSATFFVAWIFSFVSWRIAKKNPAGAWRLPPTASTGKGPAEKIRRVIASWWMRQLKGLVWQLPLTIAVMAGLLTFVIANFRMASDAASPGIPRGSFVMANRLARQFSSGDVVAYRHNEERRIARVASAGPINGVLQIQRRNEPAESISTDSIIGKVIFNTRGSETKTAANLPHNIPATERQLERVIDQRLKQAGFDAKAVFVTVSPKLDRAECRLQDVRQGGMGAEPFGGGIRIKRVNDQSFWKNKKDSSELLWSIEGINELSQVRFTTATSPVILPAAISDSESENKAFGPVIEQVLPDPDNRAGKGNRETLNLRTGERSSILDDAPKEQGGRLRALAASEGDLFAEYDDYVSKNWALVTAQMRFSDFSARQWDSATAQDVVEALRELTVLQKVEHSGATLYLLPENFVPLTLAFETRDGTRGLLQITKFEDNPRSLKIRYKRMQSDVRGTQSLASSFTGSATAMKSNSASLLQSHAVNTGKIAPGIVPSEGIELPSKKEVNTLTALPPVVVETHPASGVRDVEPGILEIRVRFSKQMALASWSWVNAWSNSAPEIIGEPNYEADGRTCVLKVKLEPARTYAFWLNSEKFKNFTDTDGRAALPYLLIFQTKQK